MRLSALLALAVAASVLPAGCMRGGGEDGEPGYVREQDAALDALLAMRGPDGRWPAGQVPYVAEAAFEAGLDLRSWPEPVPLADQAAWPPEGGPLLPALRPLHAYALAHVLDAPEGPGLPRVRDRVLAGFAGGQFGDPALLNDDAFALIVLGATGDGNDPRAAEAARNLLANQSADGGWSWAAGGDGETDMTGIVLAGIASAGVLSEVDAETAGAARSFLAAARADGGGYALAPGGQGNCDSTVWAIRALHSLGEAPPQEAWDFLLGLQRGDGSFAYLPGGGSNALCTAEAAALLAWAGGGPDS